MSVLEVFGVRARLEVFFEGVTTFGGVDGGVVDC